MQSRVLVIDDEPKWSALFKDILAGWEFKVDVAEDRQKARLCMERSRFNLVLLDVCLDQPDYSLACQAFHSFLHQTYPYTPVVAMTGKPLNPEEMRTLYNFGIAEFFHKQKIQLSDMRQRIQQVLKNTCQDSTTTTNVFDYDVFISYSHADKDWVLTWLVPQLEETGIKVGIDFRHFKPGAPILAEMERVILQSRKTLLVITPDFFAGEWTKYEESLAQILDPTAEQRRVIPLLVKPCDELPLRIRCLNYLDFTQREQMSDQFDRLAEAIKSPLN